MNLSRFHAQTRTAELRSGVLEAGCEAERRRQEAHHVTTARKFRERVEGLFAALLVRSVRAICPTPEYVSKLRSPFQLAATPAETERESENPLKNSLFCWALSKGHSGLTPFLVWLFSATIILFPCAGFSDALRMQEGTVRYRVMGNSPFAFNRLYAFKFQVDGCRWAARIEPIAFNSGGTNINIADLQDYEVASYDGQTVYYLSSYETIASRSPAAPNKTVGEAYLFQEEIPWGVNPVIAHLWLVFGSRCYLERQGSGQGAMMPLRYGFKPTTKAEADQKLQGRWQISKLATFTINNLVAMYSNPQTSMISTNLVVEVLPQLPETLGRAEVTVFYEGNVPFTQTEIVVTTTDAHSSSVLPYVPLIPGKMPVTDNRLFSADPPQSFSYVMASRVWPELRQVRALYASGNFPGGRSSTSNTIRLILIISITLPVLAIIARWVNQKKQQQKDKQ